ncbi:helix-turn-helix transcriptional regulator [Rhizobium leguminosarum]|uniref:helix-turn-helix transcriptional regulator n=1 Tax=Rhizobium leguminosarum TaxID=384 RepID=UPI003F9C5770
MSDEAESHKLFTPKSLAERWCCSERHIRNMMASGQLPYFRVGAKLKRIKWKDVDGYERNQIGE